MRSSISKLALCLSFLLAAPAEAGIEVRWSLIFRSPGVLGWSGHLHLVAGALEPGATVSQHVTFYDFENLLNVSTAPPGWTVLIQERGIDARDVAMRGRDDSPRFMNVTWTWNGTTRIEAPAEVGRIGFAIAAPGDTSPAAPFRYVSQTSGHDGPYNLSGYAIRIFLP